MPSAPSQPLSSLSVSPTRCLVLVGAAGGGQPATDDEVTYLQAAHISVSAGGQNLDHAKFVYDLAETGEQLENLQLGTGWNRWINVLIADDEGTPTMPIFSGELGKQTLAVDRAGEHVTLTARIEPFHFGQILEGYAVYDPQTDGELTIHEDAVFNPEVDGYVVGNQSSRTHSVDLYKLFVHPESIQSTNAEVVQQDGSFIFFDRWDLQSALATLTWQLNPSETNIDNPTDPDPGGSGTGLDIFDDAPAVRNVILRRGHYLPALLDGLLHPRGYDWRVNYAFNNGDAGDVQRNIRVFQIGVGPEKEVHHQPAGSDLDTTVQQVDVFKLDVSIVDMANVVIVHGSLIEREVTIELYRNWSPADDNEDYENLSKKGAEDGVAGNVYATKKSVWREWMANEDGSLSGLRNSGLNQIPAEALDLSSVFGAGNYTPRRREMGDCLTWDKVNDGDDQTLQRRPPVVELSLDAGNNWQDVNDVYHVRLMNDRIGLILEETDHPPLELMSAGDDARVRITCTIRGDRRVNFTTTRQPVSPNSNDIKVLINAENQFHNRKRQETGDHKSELIAAADIDFGSSTWETGGADEDTAREQFDYQNDSVEVTGADDPAIETYAEALADVEESADLVAAINLYYISFGYQIGDLITRLAGKNISLNRNSDSKSVKRYMQISAIDWDFENQSTTLTISSANTRTD